MRITFSIDTHDRDGDVTERGIYLHMGPVRVRIGATVADLRQIVSQLEEIAKEIEDPEAFFASKQGQ